MVQGGDPPPPAEMKIKAMPCPPPPQEMLSCSAKLWAPPTRPRTQTPPPPVVRRSTTSLGGGLLHHDASAMLGTDPFLMQGTKMASGMQCVKRRTITCEFPTAPKHRPHGTRTEGRRFGIAGDWRGAFGQMRPNPRL